MAGDLSARLVLLRKEKGISQKAAAGELAVSQALLSHYERGIRECGLEFLMRAADYYEVSTDYLLGRTMDKTNTPIEEEERQEPSKDNILKGSASAMMGKRLVINSIQLIFDIADSWGGRGAVLALYNIFYLVIYKCFRYFYIASNGADGFLTLKGSHFPEAINSRIILCEMELRESLDKIKSKKEPPAALGHDELRSKYPQNALSLLHVLGSAEQMVKPKGSKK